MRTIWIFGGETRVRPRREGEVQIWKIVSTVYKTCEIAKSTKSNPPNKILKSQTPRHRVETAWDSDLLQNYLYFIYHSIWIENLKIWAQRLKNEFFVFKQIFNLKRRHFLKTNWYVFAEFPDRNLRPCGGVFIIVIQRSNIQCILQIIYFNLNRWREQRIIMETLSTRR